MSEKLVEMPQNNDLLGNLLGNLTGNLLGYSNYENYYKLTGIDLSRQTNTTVSK